MDSEYELRVVLPVVDERKGAQFAAVYRVRDGLSASPGKLPDDRSFFE